MRWGSKALVSPPLVFMEEAEQTSLAKSIKFLNWMEGNERFMGHDSGKWAINLGEF